MRLCGLRRPDLPIVPRLTMTPGLSGVPWSCQRPLMVCESLPGLGPCWKDVGVCGRVRPCRVHLIVSSVERDCWSVQSPCGESLPSWHLRVGGCGWFWFMLYCSGINDCSCAPWGDCGYTSDHVSLVLGLFIQRHCPPQNQCVQVYRMFWDLLMNMCSRPALAPRRVHEKAELPLRQCPEAS